MYALIYDEYDHTKPKKEVLSVHWSRKAAEGALVKRRKKLQRKIWECHTRIVWAHKKIKAGEFVTNPFFSTWAPGENIPHGELYPDTE